MQTSQKGIDLIKSFEGCRLKAYKCPAGVWTIGYGQTGPSIKEGLTITQAEAEAMLIKSLAKYEANVNKWYKKFIWTQTEFDALVSFAYNLGSIDKLVAGCDFKGQISDRFHLFVYAKKVKLNGLVKRRKVEKELFDTLGHSDDVTVTQLAREVIEGLWGVGETRKTRLTARGYDYKKVQAEVNRLLKG